MLARKLVKRKISACSGHTPPSQRPISTRTARRNATLVLALGLVAAECQKMFPARMKRMYRGRGGVDGERISSGRGLSSTDVIISLEFHRLCIVHRN
jgi:hypothetical protein